MGRVAVLVAVLLACGSDEPAAPDEPEPGIPFGDVGSLVTADGRGSFRFGVANSATQIEEMNSTTDWYVFTQRVEDGGLGRGAAFVGDAAMGYSRAIEDVGLVEEMNLDSYRFSIEWARIEPERDVIDEEALQHYSDLLDAIVAAGLRPVVTVHHFANPVWVSDPRDKTCADGPSSANLCGFLSAEGAAAVAEEMAEHARLLGERFGDRVDEWVTLNEPMGYLVAAYGADVFPPGLLYLFDLRNSFMPVVARYLDTHAAAYRALKEADTADADGDGVAVAVGMAMAIVEFAATRDNLPSEDPVDIAARDRMTSFTNHLMVDALVTGSYDADLDGAPDDAAPAEWQGTLDWLGVQYYMRVGVTGSATVIAELALTPCLGPFDSGACLPPEDATYCVPTMGYESYLPGLYTQLVGLHERFPGLPLVVTEAGIATLVGERRAENVVRVLEQIDRALQDGVDVRGYYHWSLYDNFEWAEGFRPRFGLYRVDYDTFERTATLGAEVYGEIARKRLLPQTLIDEHGGDGPFTPEDSLASESSPCVKR